MHTYGLQTVGFGQFMDFYCQTVSILDGFHMGPSLQALRADTMVDGLPRAFMSCEALSLRGALGEIGGSKL